MKPYNTALTGERTEDEEMTDLSKMSIDALKRRRANKETDMLIPESSFDELARRLEEAKARLAKMEKTLAIVADLECTNTVRVDGVCVVCLVREALRDLDKEE